jgi:hypothetical protein
LVGSGKKVMSNWLKKSVVVLISILSFGLISPPQVLLLDKAEAENPRDQELSQDQSIFLSVPTLISEDSDLENVQKQRIKQLLEGAQNQAFIKFGEKIKPIIEDEVRDCILPKIEIAIAEVAAQFPEEESIHLKVSEFPGKGKSEKIFHVINQNTGKDVIRFHVRRDQPPQQGYWFNFHYHTYHDQFLTHYDLGSIYWAKNTPPNWMS